MYRLEEEKKEMNYSKQSIEMSQILFLKGLSNWVDRTLQLYYTNDNDEHLKINISKITFSLISLHQKLQWCMWFLP